MNKNELLATYWSGPEIFTNALILLHLAGALALGLLVGYERAYHGRAAGMRTYGLVCMASAALTILAGYPDFWYGGGNAGLLAPVDPTRIIQGVVTGIGFLGAGVIMREGFNISGLTTAASIWASSAIGILVGVGFYLAAMGLAFFSSMIMIYLNRIESFLPARHAVAVRVVERFREARMLVRQRGEQLHRLFLHAGVLGVLEGHVGEGTLHRRQCQVRAGVDQLARGRQGQRVAGEGIGRVAVGVARELVEHQQARQHAAWAERIPFAQAARHRLGDGGIKALADLRVEGVVLAEPFGTLLAVAFVRRRQEPEIEDILRLYVCCFHGCSGFGECRYLI